MNRYKLGVSAINWVNEDPHLFEDNYTCDQLLSEMSQLGFAGTELSRKFPRDIERLTELLNRYNLCLASGWKSVWFSDPLRREEEMNAYREHVDFLKAMGCRHVVTCEIRDKAVVPLTEREWDHLVDGLHEAGRYCKENGMQLVYHFHAETVVEGEADIRQLVERTDPDFVHLLYDTGHAYYGGCDPLTILQTYYDRIKYIHLKDVRPHVLDWVRDQQVNFSQAVKQGVFTVPGDGCIDFGPIFQELNDRGYEGWLIVEAEQNPALANPYEYALRARDYILDLIRLG